jgi:hypothetical protein
MSAAEPSPESVAPVAPEVTAKTRRWKPWSTKRIALALFALLVIVYQINGTVMEEGDPVPNLKLPVALLKRGQFSFSPNDFPEMFMWKSSSPLVEAEDFPVHNWDDYMGDRTLAQWRELGTLKFNGPRYHLLQSPVRDAYVSTFGPVPGATFLPMVAVLRLIDPEYDRDPILALSAGKLHGSLLTAASAVLLFLTALRYTTRYRALLLGAVFGVATCAWSIQSQNVWQQTVSTFCICLGTFCFLRSPESPRYQLVAGLAFGTGTACRHTGALLLAAVFVYMVIYHRRTAIYLALGAAPVPLLIAVYNWYYFGSPFSFGQELVGHHTAMEKTGSPELWQTPFFEGLLGLLLSPSRGLFVFSPFFLVVPLGLYRIIRDPSYRALRPLCLGAFAIMALQCKWFDWWGGWTYGYRPWLDAIPILVLCLLPVITWLTTGVLRPVLLGITVAWSAFVQFVGAFTYDKAWNERTLYVVQLPGQPEPQAYFTSEEAEALAQDAGGTYLGPTRCNIDVPHCRYRLWSADESIILYYLTGFYEARSHRAETAWASLFRRP